MSAILVFLSGIFAIITWWMARQRLASKPWLEIGLESDGRGDRKPSMAVEKIGLGIFLAVIGALFTLFISAYLIRMGNADWWAIPIPSLIWVNTGVLIFSSAAVQWSAVKARQGRSEAVRTGLLVGFTSALAFLSGQILAWRQLTSAGYLLADNPANSFFYLLTGMHGLHILGGLAALGRTMVRSWRGGAGKQLRLGVELCAIYWHFMLFVWLILLALFAGWANDFVDICRQLLT